MNTRLTVVSGAIWYLAWFLALTGLTGAVGVILALAEARFLLALFFGVGASLFVFSALWLWRRRDLLADWLEGRIRHK
jgi:hypothetical protein